MQKTVAKIRDKIEISFKYDGLRKYFDDDKEERNCYIVTVKYNGKQTSFNYGDSLVDTIEGNEPKASDILYVITSDYFFTKDNYPTYKDFAEELGYDTDSIKGLKSYERCLQQGTKLHKVFTEEDVKKLQEELDE